MHDVGASGVPGSVGRYGWGGAFGTIFFVDPMEELMLHTSPSYALLRQWHQLPPVPYLGDAPPYIRDDPNLEHV